MNKKEKEKEAMLFINNIPYFMLERNLKTKMERLRGIERFKYCHVKVIFR